MAVQGVNQSRLSVTFDRLIFDNYNIRMPFAGLSQAGEAGLQDKVKRHYLATFGAAGAVGVISGLTLRNTQTTGFNVPAGQAARMEAGRSLGESTSAIMNRYLTGCRRSHSRRPPHPHLFRFRSARTQEARMNPAKPPRNQYLDENLSAAGKSRARKPYKRRSPTRRTPSTPLGGAAAPGCSFPCLYCCWEWDAPPGPSSTFRRRSARRNRPAGRRHTQRNDHRQGCPSRTGRQLHRNLGRLDRRRLSARGKRQLARHRLQPRQRRGKTVESHQSRGRGLAQPH